MSSSVQVAREGPPRRSRLAFMLSGIGVTLLLLGVVLLALPTSTHQDVPGVGEDMFFDCGGPLYPSTRPAEEPGTAACRELNASMLRHGLVLMAVGVVMTVGGGALRRRVRRRWHEDESWTETHQGE